MSTKNISICSLITFPLANGSASMDLLRVTYSERHLGKTNFEIGFLNDTLLYKGQLFHIFT